MFYKYQSVQTTQTSLLQSICLQAHCRQYRCIMSREIYGGNFLVYKSMDYVSLAVYLRKLYFLLHHTQLAQWSTLLFFFLEGSCDYSKQYSLKEHITMLRHILFIQIWSPVQTLYWGFHKSPYHPLISLSWSKHVLFHNGSTIPNFNKG